MKYGDTRFQRDSSDIRNDKVNDKCRGVHLCTFLLFSSIKAALELHLKQRCWGESGVTYFSIFTPNVLWGDCVRRVKSPDQTEGANKCHFKLGHHSPYTQEVTHRDTIWSLRSASSVNELIHGWRSRAHGHQCIRAEKISRPTCEDRKMKHSLLWRPARARKRMSCSTLRVHRACSPGTKGLFSLLEIERTERVWV